MKLKWKQSAGMVVIALLLAGAGVLVVGATQAQTLSAASANADEPVWTNHSVHITIDVDGEVERVVTSYEYRGELYEFIVFGAENEGYRSVEEYYETASEEESDANVTAEDFGDRLVIVAEETDLGIPDGYERTIDDGILRSVVEFDLYQETDEVVDTDEFDSFDVNYTIEMPGEIVDSNADSVDGNLARWEVDFFEVEPDETLEVAAQLEEESAEETAEVMDEQEETVQVDEPEEEEEVTETVTDVEITGDEDENREDDDSNTLLSLLVAVGVTGLGYWYYRRSQERRA